MTQPTLSTREKARIIAQLKPLEPLIYRADAGEELAQFERQLSPDFWEVGASGRVYDRAFVLRHLAERRANPRVELWHTDDYEVRQIEAAHYLLTYSLQQPSRLSRRASLWHKVAGQWQMLYHQGTVVLPGEL